MPAERDPLERLRLPIVPIEPRPEFAEGLLRGLSVHGARQAGRETPTIRYFVDDLEGAVAFYRDLLGFEEELRPSSVFAMLYRGDLRLLLSVPGPHRGGHALADGTLPVPGGWNRILVEVSDLDAAVQDLRQAGARFLDDVRSGVGVRHVVVEDPSGNPIELFEPGIGYYARPR